MVQIKGTRDGLLATIEEGTWPELRAELLNHLDEQADFLRGARLALDVGERVLRAAELGELCDRIAERDISLWAVISQSTITEQTAQMLGLGTRLHMGQSERPTRGGESSTPTEDAVLIRRTLRSGFRLQHSGHVVVVGDVNPGAEIIAGGDILVWGRLRGMVHAGAQGDENAVVCALELAPTQLRIAGEVAITPPKRGNSSKVIPEMAHIHEGQVLAEAWTPSTTS